MISDDLVLVHEAVVGLFVGGVEGDGVVAGLDGFLVFIEFGVAEAHIEEGVLVIGVVFPHVLVVEPDRLLVLLALESLVSPLLQAHRVLTIIIIFNSPQIQPNSQPLRIGQGAGEWWGGWRVGKRGWF